MSEPLKVRLTGTAAGTLDAVVVHVHLVDPAKMVEAEEEES